MALTRTGRKRRSFWLRSLDDPKCPPPVSVLGRRSFPPMEILAEDQNLPSALACLLFIIPLSDSQ